MRLIGWLLAAALSMPAHAADGPCTRGAAKPASDLRIHEVIASARQQHALFGGQVIDRSGRIVTVGFHEAEFDRPAGESTPTWKRVADYWTTLDAELPPSFRSPDGALLDRKELFGRIAALGDAGSRLDDRQLGAVESAFVRSALVDHPWSAVFISFLMKKSNFSRDEFEFSDSHVDYVDQAVSTTLAELRGEATSSAYRGCDLARTRPRPGDLVCYTRGRSAGIDSHARLLEHLQARRSSGSAAPLAMHCDLVARADDRGDAKIETIGGNVFQSVTLRRMTLNASKTLSRAYFPSGSSPACTRGPSCVANLGRKPWVVLLQFRN